MTWSPGLLRVTPAPTFSTTPAASWPRAMGRGGGHPPLKALGSLKPERPAGLPAGRQGRRRGDAGGARGVCSVAFGKGREMAVKYRADQVGSFLRPPELLEARVAHAQGRLSIDELRAAEDEAILRVLALQRPGGIDIYSDGGDR